MKNDQHNQEQVYICNNCGDTHTESTVGSRLEIIHDGVVGRRMYCGPVGCGSEDLRLVTEIDAVEWGKKQAQNVDNKSDN